MKRMCIYVHCTNYNSYCFLRLSYSMNKYWRCSLQSSETDGLIMFSTFGIFCKIDLHLLLWIEAEEPKNSWFVNSFLLLIPQALFIRSCKLYYSSCEVNYISQMSKIYFTNSVSYATTYIYFPNYKPNYISAIRIRIKHESVAGFTISMFNKQTN